MPGSQVPPQLTRALPWSPDLALPYVVPGGGGSRNTFEAADAIAAGMFGQLAFTPLELPRVKQLVGSLVGSSRINGHVLAQLGFQFANTVK